MQKSIIISEVTHTGEVHLQVNSCFVEMIAQLNSAKNVLFCAEDVHNHAVEKSLNTKVLPNLKFFPFKAFYNEKKFKWGKKIIGECKQILKLIKFGKKQHCEQYIWTCLFPTSHLFLNILNLFNHKSKHLIILHGELELLNGVKKRKSEYFLRLILKTAFLLSTKNVKYLVLGDNIKKSLTPLLSAKIIDRTHSILHPYHYSIYDGIKNTHTDKILSIGAIGTQMLSKNSNFLYELASYFKHDVIDKQLSFISIGKILPELKTYDNGLVVKLYADSFVEQNIFELEILKLNFIVFFYDNSAYKLCASGAIFEAIRLGIPIISLKNDYFQWIFESYGVMGFLCDDLEEMKILVEKLVAGDYKQEMDACKINIDHFKINNDLKSISSQLKDIIS